MGKRDDRCAEMASAVRALLAHVDQEDEDKAADEAAFNCVFNVVLHSDAEGTDADNSWRVRMFMDNSGVM